MVAGFILLVSILHLCCYISYSTTEVSASHITCHNVWQSRVLITPTLKVFRFHMRLGSGRCGWAWWPAGCLNSRPVHAERWEERAASVNLVPTSCSHFAACCCNGIHPQTTTKCLSRIFQNVNQLAGCFLSFLMLSMIAGTNEGWIAVTEITGGCGLKSQHGRAWMRLILSVSFLHVPQERE